MSTFILNLSDSISANDAIVAKAIQTTEMASDGEVNALMWQAIVIAIGVMAVIYLLAQGIYKLETGRWKGFWGFLERNLTYLFIIAWVLGFSVYAVGTFIPDGTTPWTTPGSWWNMIRLSPVVIVHAFEMFLLQSDVSAVHDEFHNNLRFMTMFSFAHFFAAWVSLMFVIKHFGYNIVAGIQLWLTSHGFRHYDQLFVFWGMNDASYNLAKDIKRSGKVKSNYMAIIVKTVDEKDKKSERTGLDRLFNFLSLKNSELDKFKELDFLSTNAFSRLSQLDVVDDARKSSLGAFSVLNEKLHLRSIVKLIRRTDRNVHIFMLGENEEDNIRATVNLRRDQDLCAYAKDGKKVYIYCHARHDSVNRVVEDTLSDSNLEVHIIDTARDSINCLKKDERHHPITLLDIDREKNFGTVTMPFYSLVVGFGQTGRDAVRFLYEYGAFVDSKSTDFDDVAERNAGRYKPSRTDCRVYRAEFHCHVVDKDADIYRGRFFAYAPALKERKNQDGSLLVDIHACDVDSPEFYERLDKIYDKLNYVIVALGDDEANITTAVRIFKYVRARRNAESMKHFRIYVHCHTHSKEQHLKNVADYYNQTKSTETTEYIVIFGTAEEIYTYDNIVENDFESEGKIYNAEYCETSGNNTDTDRWDSRHDILLSKRSLASYGKLRRQEYQDVSNAYHALTKLHIMKKLAELDGFEHLSQCLDGVDGAPMFQRNESGRNEKIKGRIWATGSFTKKEQQLMLNLARLEHIRWNASHEVLGYQGYEERDKDKKLVEKEAERHGCNETYRLHNCLIDWQQLDEESENAISEQYNYYPDYKLFDYAVITTTIRLYAERRRIL